MSAQAARMTIGSMTFLFLIGISFISLESMLPIMKPWKIRRVHSLFFQSDTLQSEREQFPQWNQYTRP
jgi:hypothetical protein